jgi:hypothetical protein
MTSVLADYIVIILKHKDNLKRVIKMDLTEFGKLYLNLNKK